MCKCVFFLPRRRNYLAGVPAIMVGDFVEAVITGAGEVRVTEREFMRVRFPFTMDFFGNAVAVAFFVMTDGRAVLVICGEDRGVSLLIDVRRPLFIGGNADLQEGLLPGREGCLFRLYCLVGFCQDAHVSFSTAFTFADL